MIIVETLAKKLLAQSLSLALAESCTGGLIASACTDFSGSSAWFDCGVVSYSNQAKQIFLGVKATTLETYGAVSEQVAVEMAEGVLERSGALISLSTTGIAGPSGGSVDKPVGLVCFAIAQKDKTTQSFYHQFKGDRVAVRQEAMRHGIDCLIAFLSNKSIATNRRK